MKTYLLTTALILALAAPAVAGGKPEASHDGAAKSDHGHAEKSSHGHADNEHHDEMAIGKPGTRADADRMVKIVMRETSDGDMIFEPQRLKIKEGETVRFLVRNAGELEHEFVLDDHHGVMKHKALMEKFPEMEHDDPNSVRLDPGENGEVVWAFINAGSFEFACLIPGHYAAGMKGDISVTAQSASN